MYRGLVCRGSGIDCSLDLLCTGGMYRKWTTGKFYLLFIKVPAIHVNYVLMLGRKGGGGECNVLASHLSLGVTTYSKLLIQRQGLI